MLIEKILGNIKELKAEGLIIDKVLMSREDMAKPHQRVRAESGDTYAVSLPYGEHISPGSVIYKDDQKVVVTELIPEDVLVIKPSGNIQWGQAAFNIGNMHQAAYLQEDSILILYDEIMEKIIAKLGIEYTRCNGVLDGIRANYTQGQTLAHDHGHSHQHSHEHNHTEDHVHAHEHTHGDEHSHSLG